MIEQFITSSILIASILAISFLMKKRLGPCIRYALWLLAAVKLLAPIPEFESPLSVMNAAGRIEERVTPSISLAALNAEIQIRACNCSWRTGKTSGCR